MATELNYGHTFRWGSLFAFRHRIPYQLRMILEMSLSEITQKVLRLVEARLLNGGTENAHGGWREHSG